MKSGRDIRRALTGWRASIDGNGEHWPAPSSNSSTYVVAEGGIVATFGPCSNPRRALAAGDDVPDTDRNEIAAEIRNARVHLAAAAPELLKLCRAFYSEALDRFYEAGEPESFEDESGETRIAARELLEGLAKLGI